MRDEAIQHGQQEARQRQGSAGAQRLQLRHTSATTPGGLTRNSSASHLRGDKFLGVSSHIETVPYKTTAVGKIDAAGQPRMKAATD